MINFFKNTKKREIIICSLIYIVFFNVGVSIFTDYGISVDEWDQRVLGFVNLKYIFQIISPESLNILKQIIIVPNISDYSENTHGPIFAVLMAFIEYHFKIEDSQSYYLVRHLINYFIFFIGNIYFFLIVKRRFNNFLYGIIGALFLFLSPRIFAESFYNNKDIIFLSFTIINLYYGIKFINKTSFITTLLFSLSTAISVDLRIIGIMLPTIIIFFYFIKYDLNKNKFLLKNILLYLIITPLLIILFWPYLWNDPVINFVNVFKSFSAYHWDGYVYYLGKYIDAKFLPWHYIFVWMGLTIPLFYIFLFIFGFLINSLLIKKRLFKIKNTLSQDNIWKGDDELEDLIYYLLLILPVFLVIILKSTIYDGWRHLYFIYPSFLLLSLKGLFFINNRFFKKRKFLANIFVTVFLIQIVFDMIKIHPHQNVYFNEFASANIKKSLERDYWGLSNKQAFEYILNNDKNEIIKIGSAGPISLENSKKILNVHDRERILITDNLNADYIINNYRNWHGKYLKERYILPDGFNIYKEIVVKNSVILSIYKKI